MGSPRILVFLRSADLSCDHLIDPTPEHAIALATQKKVERAMHEGVRIPSTNAMLEKFREARDLLNLAIQAIELVKR